MRYSHALRFVPSVNWWKAAKAFSVGLLDEVLGVGGVARHAQGGAVELVEERHRVALEPRGPLLGGLGRQDRAVVHGVVAH